MRDKAVILWNHSKTSLKNIEQVYMGVKPLRQSYLNGLISRSSYAHNVL